MHPDLNIKLYGPDYEPADWAWRQATAQQRRTYWRHLADFALHVKRGELRRGLDADGRRLLPVRRSSRPDLADGPPLTPHYGLSRTSRLLAAAYTDRGATLYWRAGWRRILGYHAIRRGPRSLPLRDVIGISPGGRLRIAAEARRWWAHTQGYGRDYLPGAEPRPVPRGEPRPVRAAGQLDLSNLTFHTGTRELAERAIQLGQFTGFRKLPGRTP